MVQQYPKRLIEVDLPIKRISAHARREKSIRHGHISTLHIWWARRPLAACRAVVCAALWPDPADPNCPLKFREDAFRILGDFAAKATSDKALKERCSSDAWNKWQSLVKKRTELDPKNAAHCNILRFALLDFIADFADWNNAAVAEYVQASRWLTASAHKSLGGTAGTRPLVVDPFAGGGSIPLEALRIGADTFASDLNPVAYLLNKVLLEYVPQYGNSLADEFRKWGKWVKAKAEKELSRYYPHDANGSMPVAYLWARTIVCEGPGCGAEIPLLRSLWLTKSGRVALRIIPDKTRKKITFEVIENARAADVTGGTVQLGSATCPCCGYTTPKNAVREQLRRRRGGTNDAVLHSVMTAGQGRRRYRTALPEDVAAVRAAGLAFEALPSGAVPNEPIPHERVWKNNPVRIHLYGMATWGDLFTHRQAVALATLCRLVRECPVPSSTNGLSVAVKACLALAVSRCADKCAAIVVWDNTRDMTTHVFGRQALPMVWDFAEANILCDVGWDGATDWIAKVLEANAEAELMPGHAQHADAVAHPLPDDSVDAFITDPPYYEAVPYATLSDFFYVWLKRTLPQDLNAIFSSPLVPKEGEIVVDEAKNKDHHFYERKMTQALASGRRISRVDSIGTVVFAHKATAGWEALLQAMLDAGWVITASWPIDTEMGTRLRARDSAALASSVHLVCRPRESTNSSGNIGGIGDWRDVLHDLPRRIHDWMPRLADEGVVGADAIFACIGPALEIFSRYSRVEKANGEAVTLKEYLEHVWAAVAKEALGLVFKGADTTGFEADARLTAMWLWTLQSATADGSSKGIVDKTEFDDDAESQPNKKTKTGGFALEYDAARKIAQGLGAHLENLGDLVEISGDQARLLAVSERTRHLFGKDEGEPQQDGRKKRAAQLDMFTELTDSAEPDKAWSDKTAKTIGETTLDRIHQSMILFAAGRGEALKRFVVEDGVGRDGKFWRLAQALSALYPAGCEEKRWLDGVLARKKQFGF